MTIPTNDHIIRSFMPVAREEKLPVVELKNFGFTLSDLSSSILRYSPLFPAPLFKAKCTTYPFENFVVVYTIYKGEPLYTELNMSPIFLTTLENDEKEWVTTEKWFLGQNLDKNIIFTKCHYSQFRLTQVALTKLTELINTGKTNDGKDVYKLERSF